MSGDESFFEFARRRRAERQAPDPRRDAIRAAVGSVRAAGPRDEVETRALLIDALADRGADVNEQGINTLVGMILRPRRTAYGLIRDQTRLLVGVAKLLREISVESPEWVHSPKGVPEVPPADRPVETVRIDCTLDQGDLLGAHHLLRRLLADVADESEGQGEQIRPCDPWLSNSDNGVEVRIGQYRMADLPLDVTAAARAAIDRWGQGTGTLKADGDLIGATVDTVRLNLWI